MDQQTQKDKIPQTIMKKYEKFVKIMLVVSAAVQVTLCFIALILPELIVGEMSKEDALDFMESLHENGDDITQSSVVKAKIGYFESLINNTKNDSNREGMVSIFAFSLLSTVSSLFTLLYAVQVLCHCCTSQCSQEVSDCCNSISDFCRKMAKSNFSSGVSSVAVAGMTSFAISDLEGGRFGTNFYLQITAGAFSCLIQGLKILVKKADKTGNNLEKGNQTSSHGSPSSTPKSFSGTPGTHDDAHINDNPSPENHNRDSLLVHGTRVEYSRGSMNPSFSGDSTKKLKKSRSGSVSNSSKDSIEPKDNETQADVKVQRNHHEEDFETGSNA